MKLNKLEHVCRFISVCNTLVASSLLCLPFRGRKLVAEMLKVSSTCRRDDLAMGRSEGGGCLVTLGRRD